MGLLQFFKRNTGPTDDNVESHPTALPDAVAAARVRARRRLIGATVLLAAGVIGFPLLFETQPRPVAVNIPIEIPRKDGAPPLTLPAAPQAVTTAPVAVPAPAVPQPTPMPKAEIVEKAADQGREVNPPKPALAPVVAPVAAAAALANAKPSGPATSANPPATKPAAAKPVPASAAAVAAKPAPSRPAAPKAPDDAAAARARALLDGQSPAPAAAASGAARVVVQVGAFTDAHKIQDVRHKLEKLGLKTYTQVIEADGAKRTRIRVGPFATRAEADKAAARIKSAGLQAAILTL